MSISAARASALRRMTDVVQIERAGVPATDDDGVVTTTRTVVWSGRGRVSYRDTQPREVTPGAAQAVTMRPIVSVPIDVTGVATGDEVLVVSCPADLGMVGRRLRVVAVPGGATSARRLECEEVQA